MSINLQEKINILYDFIYNIVDKNCFEIDSINIKNIKKDDYKITDTKLCENILEQILLESTLQYFTSDDKNLTFKQFTDQNQLLIKLSVDDIEKQDNDSKISYILSELVLRNKTKHILLPILNLEMDMSKLKTFTNIKSIDAFNKAKICGVKIRENFHKINTMQKYLEEHMNERNIKIILWQIIHTLYVIKEKFPNFVHNKLNVNNILIYQKNIYDNNIEYKYDNTKKIINNTNLEIKITNFENSMINSERNDNDLDTLVNSILKLNLKLDLETKKFLNEILKNNLNNIMNNKYFSDLTESNNNIKGIRKINTTFSINKTDDSVLGDQKLLNTKPKSKKYSKNSRKIKNMDGGDPNYKTEKNTPYLTNDERETKTKKFMENPPREPPVILEQKIYDTNQNKYTPPPLPPATIPVYDNQGGVVAGLPVPYSNQSNPYYQQAPQKIYNVSIANPVGNYTTINRIFEDIIPGDPRLLGYNSIYERTELIKWLRNIMIQQNDGEIMDDVTLLSYIKLVDVNPFSLDKNRYIDLPRNFLIYRSAYPIRLDDKYKNIQIAKHSTGVNVRLYNLTFGEDNASIINSSINKFKFNIWREVAYYNYIRKNIFHKKISQNFVSSILYKIDNKSDYKWTELSLSHNKKRNNDGWINDLHILEAKNKLSKVLKNHNVTNNTQPVKIIYVDDDSYIINKFYNDIFFEVDNNKLLELEYNDITKGTYYSTGFRSSYPFVFIEYIDKDGNTQQKEYEGKFEKQEFINWIDIVVYGNNKLDITVTSNKTLILLTESPNTTFLKWIAPVYESQGSRQNMIATGYHSLDVYRSIIFQIVYIFSVLQKERIDFEELSLENNFFIKDLNIDKNVQNYWIYNIDSVDYYVPNYGYLVLFDSKYSDIKNEDDNFKYKINSLSIFSNENDEFYDCVTTSGAPPVCKYHSELNRKFNEIISPNQFKNIVRTKCGVNLDDEVINLLTTIYNNNNDPIYKKFFKCFPNYLHNRIGTYLLKSEVEIISILYRPNFNDLKGKLIVYEWRFGMYKWVLYDTITNPTTGQHQVYSKDDNNNIIPILVYESSLYGYPSNEILQPDLISGNQINDRFIF